MKQMQFSLLSILLTCSLVISGTAFANSEKQDASAKHWRTAPSMPYQVQEIYPVFFNGHIVVAGGLSPNVDDNPIGISDRVVVFNIDTQTWSEAVTLPEPRHHPILVVVGDRLLSFGGFTMGTNGIWHNSRDVLELIADENASGDDLLYKGKWQKIAQMPAPLAETLSAVNDGVVHLVSGRTPAKSSKNSQWNHHTDVDSHYTFDPNTLTWSQAKPLPTARNSACSVQHNGNWYTIAGRTVANGNLASHEVYNFKQKVWQKLAPLPDPQGGLACSSLDNKIYVFGGEYFNNGGGVFADVWEYTIASDSWRSVANMPKPRHGLGTLNINNSIYVIGGALQAGGNQTIPLMSVFTP